MIHDLELVAIVGSLRAGSLNRRALDTAGGLLPDGVGIHVHEIADLPFYNADVEASGAPDAVTALNAAVSASNGLVIFTPEYNRSIPAVTKNAVDWLSRPRGANPLVTTPVGIVAATAGGHTATGVRDHLAQTVAVITDLLFPESLGLPGGAAGLAEPATRDALAGWIRRFAAYAAEARTGTGTSTGADEEEAA